MGMKEVIEELAGQLERVEPGQSSHWREMMANASWRSADPGPKHGLGEFIPWNWKRALLHYLLQTPFRRMGAKLDAFEGTLSAAHSMARAHGRVLDLDDLRHVLALARVRQVLRIDASAALTVAIIGDGYARLSSLLLQTLPNCRVILVNLTKALMIDLLSLQRFRPDVDVALMTQGGRKGGPATSQVIAIPAGDADLLAELPFDGAFNLSSMQEMDPSAVANYFGLLRRNPSLRTWFYCANATEKRLPDGTYSRFYEYPWQPEDEILLDELCPWAQKNYQMWPPRYFPRLYDVRHRLAWLRKATPLKPAA
jgi:putative sugar O-methyltransferase